MSSDTPTRQIKGDYPCVCGTTHQSLRTYENCPERRRATTAYSAVVDPETEQHTVVFASPRRNEHHDHDQSPGANAEGVKAPETWNKRRKVQEEPTDDGGTIATYKDGTVVRFNAHGKPHCEDGPAVYKLHRNGQLKVAEWYRDGMLHRDNDEPAKQRFDADGTPTLNAWYKDGLLHRDGDKPAYDRTAPTAERIYAVNDQPHRDGDKPAIIRDGEAVYCQNGKIHRDGDKPAVEGDNGTAWYQDGKPHRDGDEPAMIYPDGGTAYYTNGELHRADGKPALVDAEGNEVYAIEDIPVRRRHVAQAERMRRQKPESFARWKRALRSIGKTAAYARYTMPPPRSAASYRAHNPSPAYRMADTFGSSLRRFWWSLRR